MRRLKVLISGGGIAGNALAFWLSKAGHDVTIIERFDSLRATGLQIDLRGHGIEVLRRMGLEQAFRAKSVPEQGWQLVDGSGRRRAFFPANLSGKGRQGLTSEFEIMRGDLVRLMYEANKSRAKYMFGMSIESFAENETSVEVCFSDGRTEQFDLLVGADGQWSRTRRMMLGPDAADACYLIEGSYASYFTARRQIQEGEGYMATWYTAPGKRGAMIRRHSPTDVQIYLACETDSERLKKARRGDVKEEKEALAEIYQGAGWLTEELLPLLMKANDFYCERLGVVKLPSWSRGRVTLVGDAAYCPSANTGMGTTSAVVGAYVLAGEVERHCGRSTSEHATGGDECLTTALQAYEDKFRPFMDQVQKGVLEDKMKMPSTALGVALFYWFVGLLSFFRFNIAEWFIKENAVRDWQLPEYKEMV